MIAGTTILFFAAFVFAYFYLRSLNNSDLWRPAGVDPPQRYGLAIVLLFVTSASLFAYASWAAREKRGWLPAAGAALALGLAGCVVQVFEYANLHFSPTDGGYASVFIGWTTLFVVFVLLTMYWVEILFAEGVRNRGAEEAIVPAGSVRRGLLLEPAGGHRGAHLGDPLPVLSRAHGDAALQLDHRPGAPLGDPRRMALLAGRPRGAAAAIRSPPLANGRLHHRARDHRRGPRIADRRLGRKLQWAHMLQHVLLLLVAPPLLALARPWNRMWRGLPLGLRRRVAQEVTQGRWSDGLRRTARFLGDPVPSWLLFSVTLAVWHIPFAYDATLRSPLVHAAEHALFFGTGLLFWTRVIDSPPWRSPLPDGVRAVYVASAMVVSWLLAIVLAFASSPLYAPYAAEATRPGGISALTDQQFAAGVMWVPGSIPFTIAIIFIIYRWLEPERVRDPAPRTRALAGNP